MAHVEVKLLRDTVTLHNLKLTSAYGTTSIQKLTLSGINTRALDKHGVTTLADRLEADGYSMQAADTPEAMFLSLGYRHIDADKVEADGISGDARALLAALSPQADINAIFQAGASIHCDKKITRRLSIVSPYDTIFENVPGEYRVTMEYAEETDAGIFKSGTTLIRNFTAAPDQPQEGTAAATIRFTTAEMRSRRNPHDKTPVESGHPERRL